MEWLETIFKGRELRKGLRKANDDDLILVSDLDEIPNLENLDYSKIKNNILVFEQKDVLLQIKSFL